MCAPGGALFPPKNESTAWNARTPWVSRFFWKYVLFWYRWRAFFANPLTVWGHRMPGFGMPDILRVTFWRLYETYRISPGWLKILVLVNFFYSKSILKRYWNIYFFKLLAKSWFWRMFFSIYIQLKSLETCFFSFWQDLGFGECSFLFEFFLQKSGKLENFSFWQELGFGECFFLLKFYLQGYWKVDFCSFWQVLGFVFFNSNSNLKKYWKWVVFSFWQDLGFGECFFYSNSNENRFKKVLTSSSLQLLAGSRFWRMYFSWGICWLRFAPKNAARPEVENIWKYIVCIFSYSILCIGFFNSWYALKNCGRAVPTILYIYIHPDWSLECMQAPYLSMYTVEECGVICMAYMHSYWNLPACRPPH